MCTLATMLLGTPSFLAPGISSLLLLFISLVDDDPECDEAEEGVLALLPPLASTLRIGRTTCRSRLRVFYISKIGFNCKHFSPSQQGLWMYCWKVRRNLDSFWIQRFWSKYTHDSPSGNEKNKLPDDWSPARRRSHHYLLLGHKLCHRDSTRK